MRFIFAILVMLISLAAHGKTTILFLNGIDGFDAKNKQSTKKIIKAVVTNGLDIPSDVGFGYWNNPGDGFFDDKIELLDQAGVSGTALLEAKAAFDGSQTMGSFEYKLMLGQKYKDRLDIGRDETDEARHVSSVVKSFSEYILNHIRIGEKFVVVAHSQGNFFSEAVDAYLRYIVNDTDLKQYKASVRYVGFASVAGSTPNNRYISANEDLALDANWITTSWIPYFSMLPRNFNICTPINYECYRPLNSADFWTKHGFQEVYTSDLSNSLNSTTFAKEMTSLIRTSLQELSSLPIQPAILYSQYRMNYSLLDSFYKSPAMSLNGAAEPTFSMHGDSPAISLPSGQYLANPNGMLVPLMAADGNHSFSVATWVKFGSLNGTNAIVWERQNGGGDYCGYQSAPTYGLSSYLVNGVNRWLFMLSTLNDQGSCIPEIIFSDREPSPTLSTWFHVAATYDQITGNAVVYVNGNIVASKAVAKKLRMSTSPYLSVGQQPWAFLSQALNGAVDDLRFYRGALSQSEVQAIFSSTTSN